MVVQTGGRREEGQSGQGVWKAGGWKGREKGAPKSIACGQSAQGCVLCDGWGIGTTSNSTGPIPRARSFRQVKSIRATRKSKKEYQQGHETDCLLARQRGHIKKQRGCHKPQHISIGLKKEKEWTKRAASNVRKADTTKKSRPNHKKEKPKNQTSHRQARSSRPQHLANFFLG